METISKKLLCAILLGFTMLFACKPNSNSESTEETVAEESETTAPRDLMYVIHEVKDYPSWKAGFDAHESTRLEHGVHTIGVAKNLDNPNKIHLSFFIDDLEKAQAFAASDDLKSRMEELGVVGPPTIEYLKVLNLVTEPTDITKRVMVSHIVNDYASWKTAYDENKPARDKAGLSERALLHKIGNPNNVFMVFAYNDRAAVQEMLSSTELKEVMEKAGVSGEVDIQYINWEELSVK